MKAFLFLSDFNKTSLFSIDFHKTPKYQNSMRICSVGAEMFHVDNPQNAAYFTMLSFFLSVNIQILHKGCTKI